MKYALGNNKEYKTKEVHIYTKCSQDKMKLHLDGSTLSRQKV
jgi:hypothetical protein